MYQERKIKYQELEVLRNSKVMLYVTGDRPQLETQISQEVLDYFVDHLDIFGKVPKITLVLYTRGGDTLAAWSLINLIKQFCEELEVIIPSKAHSAGTLIALGANKIVMTKQSTLGPIDPSVNGPLNPQNPQVPQNPFARVPVSVESIKGFFDLAREELKIINENNLKDIFTNLLHHVHPIVLGDVFRARTQIQMLAKKLLSSQIQEEEKTNKIISFLCSDSGSHDYTINRKEAKDELGLNIEKPDEAFYNIIKAIFDDFKKELDLKTLFDPNVILGNQNNLNYSFKRCLIESITGGSDFFVSEGVLTRKTITLPQPQGLPPLQRSIVDDQRNYEGWKHDN